jgi:hypothetical protein
MISASDARTTIFKSRVVSAAIIVLPGILSASFSGFQSAALGLFAGAPAFAKDDDASHLLLSDWLARVRILDVSVPFGLVDGSLLRRLVAAEETKHCYPQDSD